MNKFPRHYIGAARKVGRGVSTLWMRGELTNRRVRRVIRDVLGEDVRMVDGAFRITAFLPNGVIKVPYQESAIKSTFTEAKLFEVVKRNRQIARYFPLSQLVSVDGIPVMVQEYVDMVGVNPVENALDSVEAFGRKIGLGDIHEHNYGWKEDRFGLYPVFVDCETSEDMTDLNGRVLDKIVTRSPKWSYPL